MSGSRQAGACSTVGFHIDFCCQFDTATGAGDKSRERESLLFGMQIDYFYG